MITYLWPLLRPALFRFSPETAHNLTIRFMELRNGRPPYEDAPELAISLDSLGLAFSNPIGLAAGFDKDVRVPGAMRAMGFGFVEAGTVTPLPQDGNPLPRLFRLTKDRAVINRLGFNNKGHKAALANLGRAKTRGVSPIGINIGANKDSSDRVADYVAGIARFSNLADYFTVNISSPNTPGLRDLQGRSALEDLLHKIMAARDKQKRRVPILLKIAPDLTEQDCEDIAQVALASGIEGLIISNTTISRPYGLHGKDIDQTGGLSGAPLFQLSTDILATMYRLTRGQLLLVGAGGVSSGANAYAKIRAGASLVQLYTALVYEGPGLVTRIKADLLKHLKRDGFQSVSDAIGADHR